MSKTGRRRSDELETGMEWKGERTVSKNETPQESSCGCGCCGGGKGLSGKAWLILTLIVLLVIALAVWSQAASTTPAGTAAPDAAKSAQPIALPKLLDLGANKCFPCKMMVPKGASKASEQ